MKVLLYPDSRLTQNNSLVRSYNDISSYIPEMFDLMYKTNGIGLAAPQVGINLQFFIMNVTGSPTNKADERVYFNPTIKTSGDTITDMEGCLSFPQIAAWIKRSNDVKLTAQTPTGQVVENFSELEARAIQHEIDHLDGLLFIERMTPADLRRNAQLLRKMRGD